MFYRFLLIAIYAISFCVSTYSQSQSIEDSNELRCKDIIDTKFDLSNFALKYNTQPITSKQITLYWKLEKSTDLTLILRLEEFSCTTKGEKYAFYFGNDVIESINIVPDNCLGYAGFKFTAAEVAFFKENLIEFVEIPQGDETLTKTISPKNAEDFQFHCDCITKVDLN